MAGFDTASPTTTYCLEEAAQQLHISTKTLKRWMKRSDIHPEPDTIDNRKFLLTASQLTKMSQFRRREVQDSSARIRMTRAETLVSLREDIQHTNERLTALAEQMKDIWVAIDALTNALAREGILVPETNPIMGRSNRKKAYVTDQGKKDDLPVLKGEDRPEVSGYMPTSQVLGKYPVVRIQSRTNLPPNLVSWRSFARLHGIPEATVQGAISRARLRIVRAMAETDRRYAQTLDQAGRAEFYRLFCHSKGFTPCPECPHAV